MYCPKCGRNNVDDAAKCVQCGELLKNPGATQQMPAQPQQYAQRPPAPPPEQTQYTAPPYSPPPPPQQPYQQPSYQYPPMAQADPGNTLSIIGIVLGAMSLLFHGLFGLGGLTLGIIAMTKKEKLGLTAIIVSVCCMVVGIIVRALVMFALLRAMHHLLPMR